MSEEETADLSVQTPKFRVIIKDPERCFSEDMRWDNPKWQLPKLQIMTLTASSLPGAFTHTFTGSHIR